MARTAAAPAAPTPPLEILPKEPRTPPSASVRYPDQPVLVRVSRGASVESQHRGSWCLVDARGRIVDSAGDVEHPFFVRSSIKALQALPLIESGAADRFGLDDQELAVCVASHDGEDVHTAAVWRILRKIGLGPEALRCGTHAPWSSEAREALRANGEEPSALHNNCSGKHAGFLALAVHLGADPARYLEPQEPVQTLVRRTVLEVTEAAPERFSSGVDGCSAPTFRVPLTSLAGAFARIANPSRAPRFGAERRAACERILRAVAAHPVLIAGSRKRLCTDVARTSGGRLFPKVGAAAIYAIGQRGGDRALAVKIDDGATRALYPLVVELLQRFDLAGPAELEALAAWRETEITNWAGVVVGRTEVSARGQWSEGDGP
jgi:L-asparaginase II